MGHLIHWNISEAQFYMAMFLSFSKDTIGK